MVVGDLSYGGGYMRALSDGRLAAGSDIKRVNIWNVTSGQLDLSLGIGAPALAQLSNGLLATTGDQLLLNIWDINKGTLVQTIPLINGFNHYFLKEMGIFLVSCCEQGYLYLWNLNDFTLFARIQTESAYWCIKLIPLSSDLIMFASIDGTLQIFNTTNENSLSHYKPYYANSNAIEMLSVDTFAICSDQYHYILLIQIDSDYKFSVYNRIVTEYSVYQLKLLSEQVLLVSLYVDNFGYGALGFLNLTTLEFFKYAYLSSTESIKQIEAFGEKN
jgi:WD40 repeat protein